MKKEASYIAPECVELVVTADNILSASGTILPSPWGDYNDWEDGE